MQMPQAAPSEKCTEADAQPCSPGKRHRQESIKKQPTKRPKPAAHANSLSQIGPQPQHLHVTQASSKLPKQNFDRHKPAIHPRNKYADQVPDFTALSSAFPDLAQHVKHSAQGTANIDFRSPAACKALTKALLKHDFNITWDVPDKHLVPPIANRSNYIHWLEDLLQLSPPSGSETITGMDIGCGANCIYPLLGAALNGWQFVGTDITDIACEWARKNVNANPHLEHLIEIRKTGASNQPLDAANLKQVSLISVHALHDSPLVCSAVNALQQGLQRLV